MTRLDNLENESIFIIREALHKFRKPAVLWSMGKDSTTLLWLIRKAFLGKVPFPVVHIDTSYKFPEIYEFRKELAEAWDLDLRVVRNEVVIAQPEWPRGGSKLSCCTLLKTEPLRMAIEDMGFDAVYLGIRRDEHGIRAKERVFSPRTKNFRWDYENQPAELWHQYQSRQVQEQHYRIHPILHFSELDVWKYSERENLPINPLYLSNGSSRYRSIGCMPCCSAVQSSAQSVAEIIHELETTHLAERAGRAQDKEDAFAMQKLRSLGYM